MTSTLPELFRKKKKKIGQIGYHLLGKCSEMHVIIAQHIMYGLGVL